MWQLKIVRQLNHTKPGRDTEIMTKQSTANNKQYHWLMNFTSSFIKPEWYQPRFNKKNNEVINAVECAHQLTYEQKNKLCLDIQNIVNAGTEDSHEVYKRLYHDKSLPSINGVVLSLKSVVKYLQQVINGNFVERQILHKKIVEMYNSGMTKRKTLQNYFNCTKMDVYEALNNACIVIKRSEIDNAAVIKRLLDDGRDRNYIHNEIGISLSYIDRVKRNHLKEKALRGTTLKMDIAS